MATETENKHDHDHAHEREGDEHVHSAREVTVGTTVVQDEEPPRPIAAPSQFGTQRFVYAGYFALGMAVAFITAKAGAGIWFRLSTWKPVLGEPKDEILMPLSAVVGLGVALYFFQQKRTRELAEEVAVEMASVTWPERKEISEGTTVVIATTLIATVFFALMDRFWGFVTNLVYGT